MGTLPTVFGTNRAWKNFLSERPLLVSRCIGLGCRGDGDQENTGTNSVTVKPFVSQPACRRLRVIQQDRVPKRPVGRGEIAVLHRKGRQSIPSSGKNNETYRLWWGGGAVGVRLAPPGSSSWPFIENVPALVRWPLVGSCGVRLAPLQSSDCIRTRGLHNKKDFCHEPRQFEHQMLICT